MFFVLSSDALFRFTFIHIAKLKKSNFFLFSSRGVCASDFISHSLTKVFLHDYILITCDLPHSIK